MSARRGLPTGVQRRHSRQCPAHRQQGGVQRCKNLAGCGYQVQAGPSSARRTATFRREDEAVAWKLRQDQELATLGRARFLRTPTVSVAVEAFLQAATTGVVLTRSGELFAPTTLAGYARDLRVYVVPRFGDRRLEQVRRADVLALLGELQLAGKPATTIRNILVPLRTLYRFAADQGWLLSSSNPTTGVPIAGASKRRRRQFVDRVQAAALLEAVPDRDRVLWATALFAGLRRGELMALAWPDVDFDRRMISVARSYDRKVGQTRRTKTAAGVRDVPIPGALLLLLLEHQAHAVGELVFSRGSFGSACRGHRGAPFTDSTLYQRSDAAWEAAGLKRITLHVARHSYGSMLLATGTPMAVVSELMGHSTIQVTVDIYGHTSDETRRAAAAALDEHLAPEMTAAVIELRPAPSQVETA